MAPPIVGEVIKIKLDYVYEDNIMATKYFVEITCHVEEKVHNVDASRFGLRMVSQCLREGITPNFMFRRLRMKYQDEGVQMESK